MTRESQEERIRIMNAASLVTPLSPAQQQMLEALYPGGVSAAGQVSARTWAPPAWRTKQEDLDLFQNVVKPYCTTCHMALDKGVNDKELYSYSLFASPADLHR